MSNDYDAVPQSLRDQKPAGHFHAAVPLVQPRRRNQVTYHRDALSILEAVPRLWARLSGGCLDCGNRARFWRRAHGKCLHCWQDLARCHWCNKNRNLIPDEFGRRIEPLAPRPSKTRVTRDGNMYFDSEGGDRNV